MTAAVDWIEDIEAALAEHGLIARGALHPGPGDGAPGGVGTLLIVGNAGPDMWDRFAAARPAGGNPLDSWSQTILQGVATKFEATALFPFGGPPHLPFQRWALRAESVHPSPIGMLIHPDYGLWHGYRGALAFADRRDLPPRQDRASPCDSCAAKPCLSTCPVSAFNASGYDSKTCAAHLRTPEGQDCMTLACRARRACPAGQDYLQRPGQASFHMAAFLAARS